MMKFNFCGMLALLFALMSQPSQAQDAAPKPAPVPDKAIQDSFNVLMGAIEDDSYTSFLTAVDEDFKVALSKPLFETVVAGLAPRQQKGYEVTYLGDMTKRGYRVSLWKLVFDDKGDDVLAEMSVKDGKVGGFFLR